MLVSLFYKGMFNCISMLSKGPPFVVAGAVRIQNSWCFIKSWACREPWEVRKPRPLSLTSGPSVEWCCSSEIFLKSCLLYFILFQEWYTFIGKKHGACSKAEKKTKIISNLTTTEWEPLSTFQWRIYCSLSISYLRDTGMCMCLRVSVCIVNVQKGSWTFPITTEL